MGVGYDPPETPVATRYRRDAARLRLLRWELIEYRRWLMAQEAYVLAGRITRMLDRVVEIDFAEREARR